MYFAFWDLCLPKQLYRSGFSLKWYWNCFCCVFVGCVSCQTGNTAPRDCGGALCTYIKGWSWPETWVPQTWHQSDDPLPATSPRPYVIFSCPRCSLPLVFTCTEALKFFYCRYVVAMSLHYCLFYIYVMQKRIHLWCKPPVFLPIAPGLHPVPGGVFPVPPAAVVLMKLLPPPTCFTVSSSSLILSSSYLLLMKQRIFFFLLEFKESVVVSCCRVPLFKWMSSWKLSGDAHFLRVSAIQTMSVFSHA